MMAEKKRSGGNSKNKVNMNQSAPVKMAETTKQLAETPTTPPKGQVGTSWANLLQDIGYLYNIPDISYDTIYSMLKDETVKAALKFNVLNIINFLGTYSHENKEIEDFVVANFENLDESFELVLEKLLYYEKAFGFAVGELVWEAVGDKWMLRKIVVLPSDTLSFKYKNKEIVAVRQSAGTEVDIPVDKVIILREGYKPYGESSLQAIYRAWKFKSVLFKFWAIAMERYAAPVLIGKTSDPNKIDDLLQNLQSLWSNGVLAIPDDITIDTLEAKNSIAEPFENAIEYANMLIYRGLLLPQLLAGTKNTGSYSLGEVHLKLFLSSVKQQAKKLSNEIIDQLVAKIIEYNFGPVESYGRFLEKEELSVEDKSRLAQAINILIQSGVLDPSIDNDWIRELFHFPVSEELSKEPDIFEEEDEAWNTLEKSGKLLEGQKDESSKE